MPEPESNGKRYLRLDALDGAPWDESSKETI
jgi:hypothetical protein